MNVRMRVVDDPPQRRGSLRVVRLYPVGGVTAGIGDLRVEVDADAVDGLFPRGAEMMVSFRRGEDSAYDPEEVDSTPEW